MTAQACISSTQTTKAKEACEKKEQRAGGSDSGLNILVSSSELSVF